MQNFISSNPFFTLRYLFNFCLILLFILLVYIPPSFSQENNNDVNKLQESATKVFLDVDSRYQEYVKIEIPFVNYVRDRKQAQVHIMMTVQETGSRGREHTITFTGLQDFDAVNDTLVYASKQMDTEEMIRSSIVKTLKMGLVRYVNKTPLANYLSVDYSVRIDPTKVVDRWDYWVFNIDTNGRLNGEESRKDYSLNGSFSADCVTPDWKKSFNMRVNYNKEEYETDERTISSYTRSQEFRGLVVKSHGEHWSSGIYGSAQSSVFSNTKFAWNIAPAIEYNVFPYSESTRKEFRILYRVGYTNIQYNEITLYNKIHEHLFNENLSGTFEIKEKWGSASATLEGSNYFHDFAKNRLELHCDITFRLFEGFSLNLHGLISGIHDQLSLPKEYATEEEVLLHQRELATQYNYFASIGLRYTFGSIYSNVVNPRFGGS